jgi:hypothetical protein
MYYQYEFAHFKGNMGHGVASDAILTSESDSKVIFMGHEIVKLL